MRSEPSIQATDLGSMLRARGHRLTEPRLRVWEEITAAGGHLTARQIAERIRSQAPGFKLSTVYRSLDLFAEMGLIRGSNLGGDGASRWEPSHSDDHFHLVCESCGSVDHHAGDLVDRVRGHVADDHGFEARSIDLVVTGRCTRCLA